MLVIITEDTGAGKQFWNCLHKTVLRNSKNCSIIGAGGISAVINNLMDILKSLENKEYTHLILLAIDGVKTYDGFLEKTRHSVQRVRNYVEQQKVKEKYKHIVIEYVQYSCLEELFLGFPFLLDFSCKFAAGDNTIFAEQLYCIIHSHFADPKRKYTTYDAILNKGVPVVKEIIMEGSLLSKLYERYKERKRRNGEYLKWSDLTSRELIASLALETITTMREPIHGFRIDKDTLGYRWQGDCHELQLQENKGNNCLNQVDCTNCSVYKDNLYPLEKKLVLLFSYNYILANGKEFLEHLLIYVNEPSIIAKLDKSKKIIETPKMDAFQPKK
jgi:hypothetical protein